MFELCQYCIKRALCLSRLLSRLTLFFLPVFFISCFQLPQAEKKNCSILIKGTINVFLHTILTKHTPLLFQENRDFNIKSLKQAEKGDSLNRILLEVYKNYVFCLDLFTGRLV
jgi:hypothetical protein